VRKFLVKASGRAGLLCTGSRLRSLERIPLASVPAKEVARWLFVGSRALVVIGVMTYINRLARRRSSRVARRQRARQCLLSCWPFQSAKYMTYPEPGGQTKRRLQCFAALPRSVCKVLLASAQIQSDNSVHTLEDGPACGIAAASDVNHLFASEH
jgi:hypothetical protein